MMLRHKMGKSCFLITVICEPIYSGVQLWWVFVLFLCCCIGFHSVNAGLLLPYALCLMPGLECWSVFFSVHLLCSLPSACSDLLHTDLPSSLPLSLSLTLQSCLSSNGRLLLQSSKYSEWNVVVYWFPFCNLAFRALGNLKLKSLKIEIKPQNTKYRCVSSVVSLWGMVITSNTNLDVKRRMSVCAHVINSDVKFASCSWCPVQSYQSR